MTCLCASEPAHWSSPIRHQARDPVNSISYKCPVSDPVEHFLAVSQVACLHGGITVSVIAAESRGLIINHSCRSDDRIFSRHNRASLCFCWFIDTLCFLVQQETHRWPVCCHDSWHNCCLWRLTVVWRKSQNPWPWLQSNHSVWTDPLGKMYLNKKWQCLFGVSSLLPQCLFCTFVYGKLGHIPLFLQRRRASSSCTVRQTCWSVEWLDALSNTCSFCQEGTQQLLDGFQFCFVLLFF